MYHLPTRKFDFLVHKLLDSPIRVVPRFVLFRYSNLELVDHPLRVKRYETGELTENNFANGEENDLPTEVGGSDELGERFARNSAPRIFPGQVSAREEKP